MSAYTAVLLYAAWMLALTLAYALPRVPQGMGGRRAPDSWERDKPSPDPAIVQRMKHAHLNATESFPIFAGVVVIAGLTERLDAVEALAPWVLYLRLAQSVLHISGTSFVPITLRATAFLAQVALLGAMIVRLAIG